MQIRLFYYLKILKSYVEARTRVLYWGTYLGHEDNHKTERRLLFTFWNITKWEWHRLCCKEVLHATTSNFVGYFVFRSIVRNSAVLATMLSAVLKANNEVRLQRSYVRWFLISTVLNAGHGYCNVYKSGGTNVCGDIFSGFDPNSKLV